MRSEREVLDAVIRFAQRDRNTADLNEQWEKLLNLGAFVRGIAIPLSEKLGYEYPLQYDQNVSAYIRRIRALLSGAETLPE